MQITTIKGLIADRNLSVTDVIEKMSTGREAFYNRLKDPKTFTAALECVVKFAIAIVPTPYVIVPWAETTRGGEAHAHELIKTRRSKFGRRNGIVPKVPAAHYIPHIAIHVHKVARTHIKILGHAMRFVNQILITQIRHLLVYLGANIGFLIIAIAHGPELKCITQ